MQGGAANHDGDVTTFSLYEYVEKGMEEYKISHTPVYKGAITGKDLKIATGYQPRQNLNVSKLTKSKRRQIDETLDTKLRRLQERQLEIDDGFWIESTFSSLCEDVSELVRWQIELMNSHPSLKKDNLFQRRVNQTRNLQSQLTYLDVDYCLDRGRVIEMIGQGGFGTVFQIKGDSGEEAFKLYHANQLHDRQKLKAFYRGFNAMKKLSKHPHVVNVIDESTTPVGFYMEYVDGPNLRDWYCSEQEKMIETLHIVAQTLEQAHKIGVIHRDIKPENILIKNDSIPLLTDFDLAWYSLSTTYSYLGEQAAFGHYLYASPEQIENPESDHTKKPTTDIYAFGQLCYFMICGKDPARDREICVNTLQQVLKKWRVAEAAKKFLQLYKTCTERTPSKRFQSMEEISNALLSIRNILLDPDSTKILTREEFIEEICFSLFGFEKEAKPRFVSPSGNSEVNIRISNNSLIHLRFDAIMGVTGYTGTFSEQQNQINQCVDSKISKTDGFSCERQKTHLIDTYSTEIKMQGNNCLTRSGVTVCYQVIREVFRVTV